jgi:hypothetical protein
MYEFIFRGDKVWRRDNNPATLLHHRGSPEDLLKRHKRSARRAGQQGLAGIRDLSPHLFGLIADPRILRLAWDHLARKGGQAPGPDGRRYTDYSSAEVWDLCRCLGSALSNGVYRPGPERTRYIDKASGHGGKRPLVIQNIIDRVVQRAMAIVVQPVLDPLFYEYSFLYRPKRSHLDALAHAEYLTLSQRRYVWVKQDIRDAFQNVEIPRLLQILYKYLPSDELRDLCKKVLPSNEVNGIRQGGPLSPLMLNLFLHHFLDHPWRQNIPDIPLIRAADDLLCPCLNEKQAEKGDTELRRFLMPAGMPLKFDSGDAINDIRKNDQTIWLGFGIWKTHHGLGVRIAERSWDRLERYLKLAHTKEHAPLRAQRTILDLLKQRGPCYRWSPPTEIFPRMVALARKFAFDEIPDYADVQSCYQKANARWGRLRKKVQEKYADRAGSDGASKAVTS